MCNGYMSRGTLTVRYGIHVYTQCRTQCMTQSVSHSYLIRLLVAQMQPIALKLIEIIILFTWHTCTYM